MPLAAALLAAVALAAPHRARADGAFPMSDSVLAPADRPYEILLATNFGLLTSVDDGQTFTWACEQDGNAFGIQYQLSAPPLHRLFVLSLDRLTFSDDLGCTWKLAGGSALAGATVLDYFPDPGNAQRVLAVAVVELADGNRYSIVESFDGGATFRDTRYTAAKGDVITGVEIARSEPGTIYVTLRSGAAYTPKLARTFDSGAHWELRDLPAALAANSVRLISIDPLDARKVFLRVNGTEGEKMAVTTDGGTTMSTPLVVDGGLLNGFARLSDGTLLVSGTVGTAPALFRSTDGGVSFPPVPNTLDIKGMAARGGVLYIATDDFAVGYALARSTDGGDSFEPVTAYADVQAITTCVQTACKDDCLTNQVGLNMLWAEQVCSATAMPRPVDGGVGIDAGGSGGSSGGGAATGGGGASAGDGGADRAGGGGAAIGGGGSGCGCQLAPAAGAAPLLALLLALLVASRRRRG